MSGRPTPAPRGVRSSRRSRCPCTSRSKSVELSTRTARRERDPADRGEDRVDRDDPDGASRLLRSAEAYPLPCSTVTSIARRPLAFTVAMWSPGVEDLDVRGGAQVRAGHVARAAHVDTHRDRRVRLAPQHEVLEVQDDVAHVLLHPGKERELVERLVEAHLGDRGPGDRRQECAPERPPRGCARSRDQAVRSQNAGGTGPARRSARRWDAG